MKTTKKLICLFLALVSSLLCFAPAAQAAKSSASSAKLPIIYIKGNQSAILYDKGGNQIWPLKTSVKKAISNNQSAIISAAVRSFTRNNWNILGDELYKTISPLFDPLLLDNAGNNQNGVTVQKWASPEKDKDGKYGIEQYIFRYDMRLDPLDTAVKLRKYIDEVLAATGKTKVNLVCRCMGAAQMSAYLFKYREDPKVNSAIFYSSGAKGVLIEEAPFCGEISLDDETMSQYVTSTGEESLSSMFQSLTNIFGSNKITEEANTTLKKAMPVILPRLLRACYANFPSYWALLDNDHYKIAKDYIFSSDSLRKKYAGLISKIDNYHYTVYSNIENTLNYLRDVKGVSIDVIAKYNCEFDPIYDGHEADGDSWIDIESQSFGATCAEHGKKLSVSYCDALESAGLGKYISSDRKIDASTCLFPDTTWFIKDCTHTNWGSFINTLVYSICNKGAKMTVRTYSNLPQFMRLKSGKLKDAYDYASNKYPRVESVSFKESSCVFSGSNKTPTVVVTSVNGEALRKNVDYKVTYQENRSTVGRHYAKVKFIGEYAGTESQKIYFNIVPANVSELTVKSYGTDYANLSWNAAKGARKYYIYLYDKTSKSWKKIGATKNTTFKAKNLPAGSNVKLAVKGITTKSEIEYASNNYTQVTATLKPTAPVVKASAGKNRITLSWKKVTGASEYHIYRSLTRTGVFTRIAKVKTTKFTNTSLRSNRTYYYRVRPIKIYSDNSFSGVTSATVGARVK